MPTTFSSSKSNLKFTQVKTARYTAKGLLKNDKGDKFHLRISGTQKSAVQKYIDYQVKKVRSKGIKVTIGSRKTKQTLKNEINQTKKLSDPENYKEYTQKKKFRGISIDISPDLSINNLSDKPLVLHYEIDPPIGQDEVHDYTFQNTGTVSIRCEASEGSVSIQLFEFKDPLHTTSNQKSSTADSLIPLISMGNPGEFNVAHDATTQGNGDWNFRVTGKNRAKYKLSFDLVWDLTKNFNVTEALKAGVALH